MANDGFKWHPQVQITKYSPEVVAELTRILGYEPKSEDFKRLSVDPYAITEVEGNELTNGGRNRLRDTFTGSGQALTSTSGRIGVGNSSTTFDQAQTDLQGASKYYQVLDSAPNTATTGAISCVATYGTGVAEFAWAEWGIDIGTPTVSAGTTVNTLMNRKVASMGTKGSGASWVFTVTITLS